MSKLILRKLGLQEYETTWRAMREFTENRDQDAPDEIWQVEHPPVFTLGRNGSREHLLDPGAIPVVQTDRGGQVTYHGPGQLILYTLIDLRRLGIGVKEFVHALEQVVIDFLSGHGVKGERKDGAPGVYVGNQKVASLGLRVRRNGCYHGLSVNVAMDLEPFQRINPCGLDGVGVNDMMRLNIRMPLAQTGDDLTHKLADSLQLKLVAE